MTTAATLLRSAGITVAVIGAQRSGSTYVADLLAEHGGIDIARVEVPLIEDPWWTTVIDENEFRKLFAARDDPRPRGFKRPDLLGQPSYAARLDEIGIEHCVISLRDPVARTISAAHWYAYVGRIDVPADMDAFLCGLPDRVARGDASEYERQILSYSMYGALLAQWRERFSGALHFVTHDDIGTNLDGLSRRLGGEPTGVRHDDDGPSRTTRRNASIGDVRQLRRCARRLRFAQSWDTTSTFRLNRAGDRPWNPLSHRLAVACVIAADRAIALLQRPVTNDRRRDTQSLLRDYFSDDVQRLNDDFPELQPTISDWMNHRPTGGRGTDG